MTRGQDEHGGDAAAAVRDGIARCVRAAGFDLEDVTIRLAGGKRAIRVVIDGDGGVDLDTAAAVSRDIAAALDADHDAALGDDPYTLEVTSRGVGSPLTEPRHFSRAAGRLVALVTADGAERTVRIVGVDGADLVVLQGRDGVTPARLPLGGIARAKVEVEFSAPPEAVRTLLRDMGVSAPGSGEPDGEGELAQ